MGEEKSKPKEELEDTDLSEDTELREETTIEEPKHIENENNTITDEDKKDRYEEKSLAKNKNLLIGLGILVCILGLFIISISNIVSKYDALVYPGATSYGEDISNLNEAQLEKKLYELKDKIDKNNINIDADNKKYNIKVKDIVSNYDIEKLSKDIISYNKDKNIFTKFIAIVSDSKQEFKFNINLDEEKIKDLENKIAKETNVNVIEPKVIISGNNISYIEGKNGNVLQSNSVINEINSGFKKMNNINNNLNIELKYKEEKPKILLKDIEKVQCKISTYTTAYDAGVKRGINVENAAEKIDDVLLMPGDEFSYENHVGPVVLSNGYTYAPVINNGELVQGVGGGVCQVSSTLYNTTLKAGILPTERRNHSKPVHYVPRGLDATLASGSIDYKFKNTYEYPIVINTKCSGGSLTVEFWSNEKAMNEIEYKPVSYVRGNFAKTYLYGYDKNGEKVYEKYIDASKYK